MGMAGCPLVEEDSDQPETILLAVVPDYMSIGERIEMVVFYRCPYAFFKYPFVAILSTI